MGEGDRRARVQLRQMDCLQVLSKVHRRLCACLSVRYKLSCCRYAGWTCTTAKEANTRLPVHFRRTIQSGTGTLSTLWPGSVIDRGGQGKQVIWERCFRESHNEQRRSAFPSQLLLLRAGGERERETEWRVKSPEGL